MSNEINKKFEYKVKVIPMLLVVLFFGGCSVILWRTATTNSQGLVLNGILRFSEFGATVFYWLLFVCCLCFVSIGILALTQKRKSPLALEIAEGEISIPSGFMSKQLKHVKLMDIVDLSESNINGQQILTLHTADKKYYVQRQMLSSECEYVEIKEIISEVINQNKKKIRTIKG